MKKLLILSLFIVVAMTGNAQNPFEGKWEGMQTNMQGYYPNKVEFELNSNKEFLMKDPVSKTDCKGTYTVSGNSITCKYFETIGSTSYVHYFVGTYDATSKKMTCTYGNYPANNWLGKWVVSLKPIAQTSVSSIPSVSTQPVQNKDADYFLSVVTTIFKTGSDNKEFPSPIRVQVYSGNLNYSNNHGFRMSNYKNELPKNSTIPLVIAQQDGYNSYNAIENSLANYKQYGLRFFLVYDANVSLDAWKIESIALKLEFKDAAGNPHPTMGNKLITFYGSNLWMDGFDKIITFFKTDKYFNPLPVQQTGKWSDVNNLKW